LDEVKKKVAPRKKQKGPAAPNSAKSSCKVTVKRKRQSPFLLGSGHASEGEKNTTVEAKERVALEAKGGEDGAGGISRQEVFGKFSEGQNQGRMGT